ncbi:UNVERIFIED_CONTAM: hypothetical protein Slati_3296300 [Sesamum latifolium]|uniref:ditrans,polycis-polyprenyl diphosphate synthase [(2E,6E)-farnesyldiphosphate specific] n=1 Tax=Sesamum latifolium TaxID=2727402 RepID=A0AAW2UZZ3_9LAMI
MSRTAIINGPLIQTRAIFAQETTGDPLLEPKNMSLEVISFSDGKHAVTKAANVLLKKHYLNGNTEKPNLTESDMADALCEIGHGGADPDLILIYGPARCHLGFPAWRIRYTEMVHMGPLKSMKFGALVKAIHRYTMVHQNYGTYIYFNYKLSLSESESPTVRSLCLTRHILEFKLNVKG